MFNVFYYVYVLFKLSHLFSCCSRVYALLVRPVNFLRRFAYPKELRQCCGLLFALTSLIQISNHILCTQESHFITTFAINKLHTI
jgi:hypothetical protein